MKKFTLTLGFVVASLFVAQVASACAMRRPRIVKGPGLLVAQTHFDKGVRAEKRGAKRSAIRHFEAAMNAKGDRKLKARAAFRAGSLHAAEGRTAKATKRLQKAVKFNRRHARAHLALAELSEGIDAVVHYRKALGAGLDREAQATTHAALATTLAQIGNREAAKSELTRARELGAPMAVIQAAEKALSTKVALL